MRSSIGGWLENSAIMPLGRALITKKVGDEIEVTVPSGDKFYLVKKIEFI